MKKFRILVAGLATLLVVAVTASVSSAQSEADDMIIEPTVMTQNLYIGVDQTRILAGEAPGPVFNTLLESDVPGRISAFADQVAVERPDIIGLQEVTNIIIFNAQGQTLNNIDYLEILMANLAGRGLSYDVSSTVTNANVALPLDLENGVFARVIDRDVIIHNTNTTSVSNTTAKNFSDNFATSLGGTELEFTRGYTAVDATISGNKFRFVNTHFEVENAPCLTGSGLVVCQDSQATELVKKLKNEKLPVILVGDFNASAGETAYDTIANAGYVDTWNGDAGFTCCEPELLNNSATELIERIDVIFYRKKGVTEVAAETAALAGRSASGLWYSDHAGVVATLDLDICDVAVPTIEGNNGSNQISGTNGDDIIFSYNGADTIWANGGDDIICAGKGRNKIGGGNGDDIIIAGSGSDTIWGNAGNDYINAGEGWNNIGGDAGNDTIIAGSKADTIYGHDGDDIIDAGDGQNKVGGGNGNDTITTGRGADTIYGNNGNDIIDAGNGRNTVGGDNGNDTITTDGGADTIYGNNGDDVVSSGGGADKLYLGSGTDTADAGRGTDTCYNGENVTNCER